MSKHRAGWLHRFTRRHQTAPAITAREGLDARRALADAPTVVLPRYLDAQADAITEELPVTPWPFAEETAARLREQMLDGVAARRSLAIRAHR